MISENIALRSKKKKVWLRPHLAVQIVRSVFLGYCKSFTSELILSMFLVLNK